VPGLKTNGSAAAALRLALTAIAMAGLIRLLTRLIRLLTAPVRVLRLLLLLVRIVGLLRVRVSFLSHTRAGRKSAKPTAAIDLMRAC
jgi:hypothetical protein